MIGQHLVLTTLVLFLLAPGAPVHADDVVDCHQLGGDQRLAACSRVIARSTTSPKARAEALASRANSLANKGEIARAHADLEEALRLDPDSGWTPIYRGLMAMIRRDREGAIKEFDEAIRQDPKNARAFNMRGITNRQIGDNDRAIADLSEAIRLDPANFLSINNRGFAYGVRGEHDRAIADFETALRMRPGYAPALNGLGSSYGRKGDRERAKSYLDQALKSDPNLAGAYVNRAVYYSGIGQYDDAIADLDVAISLEPGNAIAFNDRGFSYSKKGNRERALAEYNSAVQINPNLILALSNRGLTYAAMGDREAAIADFTKVIALPAPHAADKQRQDAARERLARLQKELAGQPARPAVQEKHKRVALIVGNGKYAHVGPLDNPANDAKGIAAALRRLGFTATIELQDASHNQMSKAIKDFGDLSDGAEWAIVFFAGHGIEVNGMSYLIPVDAALKRDTHVEDEAISLSRVMAKVDAASRIGLIILDSCRNNPFASRMVRSAGATRSIASGLAPVDPEGNVLVAFSAKHGTTAEDGSGRRHSPFTEALLAHIEEPNLEVNFLFRKVRDAVRRKTERRQEPFVYGSLGSDPMYFKSALAR